ncbi:MAG: DNA repair exonuclease, partial [Clostridia bacterium]|nr:DNA repair exonuclease [Clostridia bacterium]
MRIIHTGDMHLDSPFLGLSPVKAMVRKGEQRAAFSRIVQEAKDFAADVLLISGDVFDSAYVSAETILFLKDCFQKIPDTAVFIAPGNHDPWNRESVYEKIDFGENVHIFGNTLSYVDWKDSRIFGYGFSSRFVEKSQIAGKSFPLDDRIGILVMHGDLAAESQYHPFTEAQIAETKLSYVALGHIHAFSGVKKAGETTYAYCGIPEGRYFDEQGVCGFVRGVVEREKTSLAFVPVSLRQNIEISVDVTDCETYEAVINKIAALIKEEKNLYKIRLVGSTENIYLQTKVLEKALEDKCFFCKVID